MKQQVFLYNIYMKIFINYVTDKSIYNLETGLVIKDLSELNNLNELDIIIWNYPGSYTSIRKSIAAAKAISVCVKSSKLLGFSLFDYLNFHNPNNFFVDKYMYWTKKQTGPTSDLMYKLNPEIQYISNEETLYSSRISCNSQDIIVFIQDKLSTLQPLKQIYFDRFS